MYKHLRSFLNNNWLIPVIYTYNNYDANALSTQEATHLFLRFTLGVRYVYIK